MSLETEARLEATHTVNEIRARGGCILMLYKSNLKDRYLQVVPKWLPVPNWLNHKFVAQANDIAKLLIEEAQE